MITFLYTKYFVNTCTADVVFTLSYCMIITLSPCRGAMQLKGHARSVTLFGLSSIGNHGNRMHAALNKCILKNVSGLIKKYQTSRADTVDNWRSHYQNMFYLNKALVRITLFEMVKSIISEPCFMLWYCGRQGHLLIKWFNFIPSMHK